MRKIKLDKYSDSDENYVSLFVGKCKSQKLLNEYLEVNYDLCDYEYTTSEIGIDYGIDYIEQDFLIANVNDFYSNNIEKIFKMGIYENYVSDFLEEKFPYKLSERYNSFIMLGNVKYDGYVKEVKNYKFGIFKFLTVMPIKKFNN